MPNGLFGFIPIIVCIVCPGWLTALLTWLPTQWAALPAALETELAAELAVLLTLFHARLYQGTSSSVR